MYKLILNADEDVISIVDKHNNEVDIIDITENTYALVGSNIQGRLDEEYYTAERENEFNENVRETELEGYVLPLALFRRLLLPLYNREQRDYKIIKKYKLHGLPKNFTGLSYDFKTE